MTPREYIEVVAVEKARYRAMKTVSNIAMRDGKDGMRYLWALSDELGRLFDDNRGKGLFCPNE